MSNNNNGKHHIFKSGLRLIGLLLSCVSVSMAAQTDNAYDLEANSNRCVALRQGQTCYKKIKLQWRAPQTDNYCLYQRQNNNQIHCWQQQSEGEFELELESKQDTTYVLRRDNESVNLAEFTITLSWVYAPKQQSSGWRLF